MMASQGDVRFTGDVTVLADASPDSALVVFGLTLPNLALTFRQHPEYFEAAYRVRLSVRRGDSLVLLRESQELARVATFDETRRDLESLVYQEILPLPAGSWTARVEVTDEYGSLSDSASAPIPARRPDELTMMIVHEVVPRAGPSDLPRMLVNPTHTVWYPVDTIVVYLEAARGPPEIVRLRLRDRRGYVPWTDSVRLVGSRDLATAVVRIPSSAAPVGSFWLEASFQGDEIVDSLAVVVAAPGLPGGISLPELRSVLRYLEGEDVGELDSSDPRVQAEAWHRIWHETDPQLDTPENEALEAYFARILEASVRYEETGWPGWLTDRGMVYMTLGPPDRAEPARIAPDGGRIIRWRYRTGDLTTVVLTFMDRDSTGRFRLTGDSRRAFERLRLSHGSAS